MVTRFRSSGGCSTRPRSAAGALATLALVFVAFGPTAAQEMSAADREQLRERVRARFEIVTLPESVGLVPKRPAGDVRLVEVIDGAVRVNGAAVTARELRDRLGTDADLVVRLSFLADADRRSVLQPEPPRAPAAEPVEQPRAPAPPPAPEPPPGRAGRDRSSMYRRGDVVRITGNLHVQEDELVTGALVMIAGSVRIDGIVRDDVVVVAGSLDLGSTAEVDGEVTVVAGSIRREPGARVTGRVNEVAIGGPDFDLGWRQAWWTLPWWSWNPFARITRLLFTLLRLALVGLVASLVLFAAPRAVRSIGDRVAADPVKSAVAGVLAQLLFLPVFVVTCVILAISIIGIPLLLLTPFALVAAILVLIVGFTGAAHRLGYWLHRRMSAAEPRPFTALWTGLLLAVGLTLAARTTALGGRFFDVFALTLAALGFLAEYLVWTVGLGGAILARFGTRAAAPAPAFAEPGPPAATA